MNKAIRTGKNRSWRKGHHRRRGSVYVLTLGLAVLLTIIGLGVIASERISARTAAEARDSIRAELLAFSGAEHALRQITQNPDWRTAYSGLTVSHDLDDGTFTWSVADDDGDLGDDPLEPATITATGACGQSQYSIALRLIVRGSPMPVLQNAAVSGGGTTVSWRDSLTLDGSVLKSNGEVTNSGDINGDVEAPQMSGRGDHNGQFTQSGQDVHIPGAGDVFEQYRDHLTRVPYTGIIYGKYFGPDNNPWGSANPDGVYYIDTGGRDLFISNTCIHGTLIVNTHGGKVYVSETTYMRNYRDDHATLLVNGDLDVRLRGDEFTFREWYFLDNLRRLLGGRWGDFQRDRQRLPNRLDGLVHVTDDCTLRGTTTIQGALICGDKLKVKGRNTIVYDESLRDVPPRGYGSGGQVVPDSCKRVVE